MIPPRTLLAVFAHPDDETLAVGSTLARYSAEGARVHLLCATRGERGWKLGEHPGMAAVARRRSEELAAAADELGLHSVGFLGYGDGRLARAPIPEAVARIARHIETVKPDVVITFGPDGGYGHPDHIAISQLATAAAVRAEHRPSKLYYAVWSRPQIRSYEAVIGPLRSRVENEERRFGGWNEWAITTRVDASGYVEAVRRAALSHRSQLRDERALAGEPVETWRRLFAEQTFYRAYSLVEVPPGTERDLFEGLRAPATPPTFARRDAREAA